MPSPRNRNSVGMHVIDNEHAGRATITHGYAINPSKSLAFTRQILALSVSSVIFKKTQEPKNVEKIYKDINNNSYYLPNPDIDLLEGDNTLSNSKAVQFLKDENGAVSMQIQLICKRPNNAPTEAALLIPTVKNSVIVWNGGQLKLSAPSYFSEDGDSGYRFLMPLPEEIVDSLVTAMKDSTSGIALKMSSHVKYKVQKNDSRSSNATPTPVASTGIFAVAPLLSRRLIIQPALLSTITGTTRSPTRTRSTSRRRVRPVTTHRAFTSPVITAALATTPMMLSDTIDTNKFVVEKFKFNPALLVAFGAGSTPAPEDNQNQDTVEKTKTINHKIAFSFSGTADNEQHIYEGLAEEEQPAHQFADRWQHTDFGIFSPAQFPNRIYMMPHALRLAYNADTSLPDVSPVIYMSEDDEPRVRLRLGLMPWYDLVKVTQLRDFLTLADSTSFMYPELITNFSAQASLALTTQFTENITTLSETSTIDVNFSSSLSLDLDVTLEFYKFITTLLEGPVGVTGALSVSLKKTDNTDDGEDEGAETISSAEDVDRVLIPFSLKLDEIANPQLSFSAPDTAIQDRPKKVIVSNTGMHNLTFQSAMPHLLYKDPNSIVPLNMFRTTVKQSLPLTLNAGSSIEIEIEEQDDLKDSVWNSIDMVLTDYEMEIDPKDALKQAHDLMPPGDLTWTLTVQSPPFLIDTLPESMANVFAVAVMIEIEGRAPFTITLTRDDGEQTIILSPSLNEIIDLNGSVDFLEYSYKTQTILNDRMLDWSTAVTGRGSRIFVFPTVPE